ncbi:hypothetical protein F511_47553 [Dorcoceras hygrometricum]|uniref:Uncharacterized protein n=1 Tax=Dorcoceras hygrometricum TaxID=472368 RepID=A0A2Z6ZQS6_9LAMI|nr:hypothetical protein F511_47553 [Dorcoceras hygrometricum]
MKRRRRGDPVASYSAISRCYLKMAKRCRLHKLIRQRFAIAIKNSAGRLCVVISADEATVSSRNAKITSRKLYASSRKLWFRIKKRRSRRSVEIQSVERFSRNISAEAREKQ